MVASGGRGFNNSNFAGGSGGGSSLTSTDQLPEGATNLYFTDERAQSAITLESLGLSIIPEFDPDAPSETPNSADNDFITSFADFTAVDAGAGNTNNITDTPGFLTMNVPSGNGSNDALRALLKSVGSTDYSIGAKITFSSGMSNYTHMGLILTDGITTSNKAITWGFTYDGMVKIGSDLWTNFTTYGGVTMTALSGINWTDTIYILLVKFSSTYLAGYSFTGMPNSYIFNSISPNFTPTHMGLFNDRLAGSGVDARMLVKFFRKFDISTGFPGRLLNKLIAA